MLNVTASGGKNSVPAEGSIASPLTPLTRRSIRASAILQFAENASGDVQVVADGSGKFTEGDLKESGSSFPCQYQSLHSRDPPLSPGRSRSTRRRATERIFTVTALLGYYSDRTQIVLVTKGG
jgi:hypothetical protein